MKPLEMYSVGEKKTLSAIAEAWPLIRPHVREAIVTLIDAELIRAKLGREGADFHDSVVSDIGPAAARLEP